MTEVNAQYLPAIVNITFYRGSNQPIVLLVNETNPDGTPGDPIDISTWSARMRIKGINSIGSGVALDTLTSAGGRILLDGPAGKVTVQFPNSTSDFNFTKGRHDIFFTIPDVGEVPYFAGEFNVEPGV